MVINSRSAEDGESVYRIRGCVTCGHRWKTWEMSAEMMMELEDLRRFKRFIDREFPDWIRSARLVKSAKARRLAPKAFHDVPCINAGLKR